MITVADVINSEKIITKKRIPEYQEDFRHFKVNIDLECSTLDVKLTMFIRKLKKSPNKDFSIGLRINGPSFFSNHTVVIVRFQGPHGGQSVDRDISNLHNNYHIHLYTEDDRLHHRKQASYKEPGDFNSFEEALAAFLKYCNIEDRYGIFENEIVLAMQYKMDLDNL